MTESADGVRIRYTEMKDVNTLRLRNISNSFANNNKNPGALATWLSTNGASARLISQWQNLCLLRETLSETD